MISQNLKQRPYTSLALFVFIYLIFNFNFFLTYFLIILGVISILEFLQITNLIFKTKYKKILTNIFFIFYASFFCLTFFWFANLEGTRIILFIFLISCIAQI